MTVRSLSVCVLVLALGACGDPAGVSDAPPTVLVTNTTCDIGRCATLEVRAYVRAFHVPQIPSGLRVLGEAPPGQTCLRFPSSWPLRIIGPDTTGKVDTTIITWTPDNADGIYLIAVDSLVYHGGGTPGQCRGDAHLRARRSRGLGRQFSECTALQRNSCQAKCLQVMRRRFP
jgi:hypothetical protein